MSEFVVRNGLIVSGSTYLEAISQSNEAYILSYDSVTNEVAYMPTSSVVVTVPGSDTQIIYNNGGVFGASSGLVFSGSRVGIGVTNPGHRLEVRSGTSNSFFTSFTPSAGSGFISIYQDSNNHPSIYGANASGTSTIVLNTSGVSYLTGGNFIIGGTADNGATLQVVGNISGSSNLSINGNIGIGTDSPIAKLSILATSTGYSSDSQIKISDSSTSYYGGLSFDDAGSTRLSIRNSYDGAGSIIGFGFGSSADKVQIIDGTGLIVNEGNVGIGTTNPQAKLDVSGSIALGGTTGRIYYPRRIVLNSAGDFAINNNADSENLLYVDTTKVWVSGSLGVGTSSPAAKLDVAYSTNPTTATPHIILTTGGTSKQAAITAESFNVGGLVFSTGDGTLVDRMTILRTNGNVGIGTTNPSHKLSVLGAVSASSFTGSFSGTATNAISASFAATASSADAFYVRGNVGIGTTNPQYFLQVNSTVEFGNTTDGSIIRMQGKGGLSQPSQLRKDLIAGLAFREDGGILNVNFMDTGNVGIGTTNPGAKLRVEGLVSVDGEGNGILVDTGTVAGARVGLMKYGGYEGMLIAGNATLLRLGHRTDTAAVFGGTPTIREDLVITASGSVGIGTINPAALLHVSQPSANTVFRLGNNTTYDQFIYFNGNNDWSLGMDYSNSNAFVLSNASSIGTNDRLVVTTGGSVGIGTASPGAKLHVVSSGGEPGILSRNASIGDTWFPYSNGQNYIRGITNFDTGNVYFTGGSVGIGIGAPAYKLHVSGGNSYMDGNLTVTGAITAQELYVQYISSSIIYSTGSNKFGDQTSDIQYFTGSILQSGSLAYFAGDVGIGTASPVSGQGTPLTLASSTGYVGLTLSGSGAYANTWQLYASGDGGSNKFFGIYDSTNAAYRLVATSGGNVGIGTNSPNYTLEVSGSTNVYHRLDVGTGIDFPAGTSNAIATFKQAGSVGGIILQEAGGTSNDRILKLNSNGDEQSIEATYRDTGPYGNLVFKTGGSNRMFISSSGNVGIGTTNPEARLTVNGGTAGSSATMVAFNNGANSQRIDIIDEGSAYGQGTGLKTGTGFGLRLWASAGPVTLNTGGSSTIALMATGSRIGIGTIDPGATLDVNGNVYIRPSNGLFVDSIYGYATNLVSVGNSGNPTNFNVPAGNVGIGFTTPDQPLAFADSLATKIQFNGNNANGYQIGLASPVAGGDAMFKLTAGETGAGEFGFYNTTNLRMVITSGGNVGIGVTNPIARLNIVTAATASGRVDAINSLHENNNTLLISHFGSSHASAPRVNQIAVQNAEQHLHLVTDSSANVEAGTSTLGIMIRSGGNVGIGTASPGVKLDVYSTTNTAARIKSAGASGSATLIINPEGAGAGSVGDGVVFFDMNSTAWAVGVDKSESSTFKIANDVYGNFSTNNYFNITTGGNVGIGTTGPTQLLHITATNAANNGLTIQNTNASGNSQVRFLNTSGTERAAITYVNSADAVYFYLASAGNILNLVGVNVGIGTTNPSQNLSVVGDFAIANTTSIQESRIGKYQSGSLGSGTHTIASISVTNVDAVFFDYVIKNSTTDLRAGTVMAVTNGSTVEYTDISTADIGDTSKITMISDVSGGNIRLRASIDTGAGSWTVRTLLRTI